MNTKLVLVGDGGVGKSTLINKLLYDEFDPMYIATLGVEVYPWNGYNIWDTAGQNKFGGLRDGYYINADLAIIMVDVTSKLTAKSIKEWYNSLKRMSPNVKVAIFLNKCDCEIKPEAVNIAEKFAYDYHLKLIRYSLKNNFSSTTFAEFLDATLNS